MVACELAEIFTTMGFPKQVVTDQGASFMGETLHAMWKYSGFRPLRTSIYHSQTNRLVERFKSTLKLMLQIFVGENSKDWPQWLPLLLFAIREVSQASKGNSPFELLYRQHPWGILEVLRE